MVVGRWPVAADFGHGAVHPAASHFHVAVKNWREIFGLMVHVAMIWREITIHVEKIFHVASNFPWNCVR